MIRNPSRAEVLKNEYGEEIYDQIEFVIGDLTNQEHIKSAMQGIQYMIHVAHPLPPLKNLTQTAVNSIKTILEECQSNGVKKLIVTSDGLTMVGNVHKGDATYSEDDFAMGQPK